MHTVELDVATKDADAPQSASLAEGSAHLPGTLEKTTGPAAPTCPLSRRELEVLAQIATGAKTSEVAHLLGIIDQTVKNQLTSILSKLQVAGRTATVVLALKNGWMPMPEQVKPRAWHRDGILKERTQA